MNETTRKTRSNLIALPLLLDELPPWLEILSVKTDSIGSRIVELSVASFMRFFAGQDVSREHWQLSKRHDGIYFHVVDYGCVPTRNGMFRVPGSMEEREEAEHTAALADQTPVVAEAVVQ